MYQLTTEAEHEIIKAGADKIAAVRELCGSYGRQHGLQQKDAVKFGMTELFGSPQEFCLNIVTEVAREIDRGEAEILYVLTGHHLL